MRRSTHVWSVWVLALLAGCGEGGSFDSSKSAPTSSAAPVMSAPAVEGRPAEAMKAAADPAADFEHAQSSTIPKSHIQSGTLTAGSIDDHEKYDEFRELVASAQQTGLLPTKRHFDGRRVPIVIRNSAGRPLADAVVRVLAASQSGNNQQLKYQPQSQSGAENSRALLELKTGSDGRAQFLPSLDGANGQTEFSLEVALPDQKQSRTQSVSMNQVPWVVTIDDAESRLPQQLDLALLVDTTGSMGDELEYLKVEIDSIAARVKTLFPNVDQRLALILYRDKGDEYVTRTFDFTNSLTDFRRNLSRQSAGGGGDYPEAMQVGLEQATKLSWRDQKTARVMFLVGDAPPHEHDVDLALNAVQTLRRQDVAIYPIAGSGAQKQAEAILRMSSFLTQGQYLFLTDHSGVGHKHAAPTTASYNVERLDQLMVRMIASELAGKTLLATDIIAIENPGTSQDARPQPQEPAQQEPSPRVSAPEVTRPTQAMNWGGSEFRAIITLSGLAVLALFERLFARC